MSLLKYRADEKHAKLDGSVQWFVHWMGGATLSKIANCRWESLNGEPRVTAYVQGEPDTFYSQPAKAHYLGRVVNGYLTGDGEGNIVFRHCYY